MKRLIASLIILPFGLTVFAGCASIKQDRKRTQPEGTAVGATAGALIGGLIGAVSGKKGGAIKGALIGAAAGYAYGTHVANQKEKYAKEEEWLDACIASAEAINEDTREYNRQLAQEIETLEIETLRLRVEYDEKRVKKSVLKNERKKVEAKVAEANEKLKRAKFEKENQDKVLAETKAKGYDSHTKELQAQINELNKYVSELESQTEVLASLSQRMVV